jgi:glycosyltransferase involved in cell wall biosynthesis
MTSLQTPPRHRRTMPSLRIAFVDAGGPGSDHLVRTHEEIGRRLTRSGHTVTLLGRAPSAPAADAEPRRIHLPGAGTGRAAALGRTSLAAALIGAGARQDVVFAFGSAGAPLVPLLRSRGSAVALHVGGLGPDGGEEDAWSRSAQQITERAAAREADALVSGGRAMADHYEHGFAVPSQVVRPGATMLHDAPADAIEALGIVPGGFHLLTTTDARARLEVAIEGYLRSTATLPLVMVGGRHADALRAAAAGDRRVRVLPEGVGPRVLEQLAFHAAASLHGDPRGSTPAGLLRAMGAGTAVVAWDSVFNREVAGTAGSYFTSPAQLAYELEQVERYPFRFRDIGELMQERVRTRHGWDASAESYAVLAAKLSRGFSTRGMSPIGRRNPLPVRSDQRVTMVR